MKIRHLQENDKQYKIFLYIFYVCGIMMASITAFSIYSMITEWQETGFYIMGEVLVQTKIPFENFANLSTWLFFSCIIGWYCCSRVGWKRTAGLQSYRMSLLQLMLLGFTII